MDLAAVERIVQQEVGANDHRSAGIGNGDGVSVDAIVGLGVTGTSVCVGEGVGAGAKGEAVGDGRLAVGVAETAELGLAAGAPQAATRKMTRSAAIGWRRNTVVSSQFEIHPPSGSTSPIPATSASGHEGRRQPAHLSAAVPASRNRDWRRLAR